MNAATGSNESSHSSGVLSRVEGRLESLLGRLDSVDRNYQALTGQVAEHSIILGIHDEILKEFKSMRTLVITTLGAVICSAISVAVLWGTTTERINRTTERVAEIEQMFPRKNYNSQGGVGG